MLRKKSSRKKLSRKKPPRKKLSRYKKPNMDEVLRAVRANRGQAVEIARACGIGRAAVYQWARTPAQWVHQVAKVTGLPLEEIRPDIFKPSQKRA